MGSDVKHQILGGVLWSAVERFSVQGVQFILSFIIARQLLPSDYGLVAMLNIFLALSNTFIDAGFSNALIQKQNRTDIDFSTVFYFNIIVAFILYGTLYLLAPSIADFYSQPLLKEIIYWVAFNVVISSFATVQRARIVIALDFKKQTQISLMAMILSGGVAIWMAYNGYGVWTLVVQSLLNNFIMVFLLWVRTRWRPLLLFSISSFCELFGFGSKLLGSSLLHTLYTNLYTLVIGKFFSATDLGYYNRAFSITQYPSSNITAVLVRVMYPIECQMQNDTLKLQETFYIFIRMTSFFVFPMMMGLAALAEPFVRIVLTDKWLGCVPYIQIMCLAYMWDPIMRMTCDLLNVKHRSDYSLKSEVYKKIFSFSLLCVTIPMGIKVMCIGLVIYAIVDILIITQFVKRLLPEVTFLKEMTLLLPILGVAAFMALIVYGLQYVIPNLYMQLLMGVLVGVIAYMLLSYFFLHRELKMVLQIIRKK